MTLPSSPRPISAMRLSPLVRATALASSLLALGGLSSAAWAQPSGGQLREVAQQALTSNPQVLSAYHGFLGAEHQVDVARGGYLPSLDVTAGIGQESREGDGRGSFDSDFAEVSLTQMIYDGFATHSEVERLDRAKLVRYYELLGASEEVTLEVTRAYQDVRRYRELVELARENYAKHQEVFEQIEQRVMAGAGRRVDLEQISGRLALAESNLITEASNLHDVSARYQRLVGALPADALAPAPSFEEELPASVNEAVQLAYEGNPGFHAVIENIAAARAERDGTRSAFQPRLDFRATAGTNNLDDVAGRRDSQTVELVASMNLYRGGSDLASFRRASDLVEQASSQRDLECTNVRQTTQIAFNDTRRLREQLNHLNQHRQSIDRVRGAYQQQFDIGQRTLLDVLDSENEYFEASRAYVNAQYDVAIADARTLAAMGRLMPALGLMSEQIPTLVELSSEGASLDPQSLCPVQAPTAQTLDDLIGDISVSAEPYAPDITLSADALFAVNSAELSLAAQGELTRLAAEIRERSDIGRIRIDGHTDSTGNDAINQPLSQARADSVADFLVSRGVSAQLIESRGHGASRPVAGNDTAQGRSQNRRVEITFEARGQTAAFPEVEQVEQPSMVTAGMPDVAEVASQDGLFLQVAALSHAERAAELEAQLYADIQRSVHIQEAGGLYRVQVGPLNRDEVAEIQQRVREMGFGDAYLIANS